MTYFTSGTQLQAAIDALPASVKGSFVAFDAFFYGQTYMSSYAGDLTPMDHFVTIGAARGYMPDATFDPTYYLNAYPDLQGQGFTAADLLYHFLKFGLSEGRAPNAALAHFDGAAYLAAYPAVAAYVNANLASFGGSATNGALAHYVKFGMEQGFTIPGSTANNIMLTTGLDTGTAFAATHAGTTFTANIVDNTNTFQSGDALTATGAGNVLNADLGNSANFAILASTTGIQTVNITAEALANGGAATNNVSELPVQINALRMANVDHWGDVQSRADVVIENISLPNGNTSADVTSAVTFTMRDTQPGSINGTSASANASTTGPSLRAYFDPQALKTTSTTTAAVTIALGNSSGQTGVGAVSNATYAATPITGNPFIGFTIVRDGVSAQLLFSAADLTALNTTAATAGTQAALTTAIQNAIAAYNTANGTNIQVTVNASGNAYSAVDTTPRVDSSYTLSETAHTLTVPSGNSWIVGPNGLPSNGGYDFAYVPGAPSNATALITSNIIVDNVGQGGFPQFHQYSGSTEGAGGDIIIGSMATSGGVQQFNVDVQRTSWNNSLQTTNNVLQVVNIVSDPTLSPTTGGQGYAIGAELTNGSQNMIDWAAPGAYVGTNGLHDVMTVNATGFNGSLEIGETITYAGFAKHLADTTGIQNFSITLGNQSNGVIIPTAIPELNSVSAQPAPFNSVNLAIEATVAASGNFNETITGGTGNDFVKVEIDSSSNLLTAFSSPLAQNGQWETNMTQMQNLNINVGSGNNVVEFVGGGAAQISGGSGNDAYYIDNTGYSAQSSGGGTPNLSMKAVWVADASINNVNKTVVPTAVESITGTPGVKAQSDVSFVNVVAGVAAVGETVTVSNPATDTQGVTVVYAQPGSGAPLATTTIAHDVFLAYEDFVLNGVLTQVDTSTLPVTTWHGTASTFGGGGAGAITWLGGVGSGTDYMQEVFTVPGGTLTVTIGNEYVVSQSAQQNINGVDTFTRTVVGPTSWSLGGTLAGSQATSEAPSLLGTQVLGAQSSTEQMLVNWSGLTGAGASESIGGITVSITNPTNGIAISADQVSAAVEAGNGTYTIAVNGTTTTSLVVAGETTAAAPTNTWAPVNSWSAPILALGAATLADGAPVTFGGFTFTNNTHVALTAAQVATDVAQLLVSHSADFNTVTASPVNNGTGDTGAVTSGLGTIELSNIGQTAAQAALFAHDALNWNTLITSYTGTVPLQGSATNGSTQALLNPNVSLDAYGNLTTSFDQGGAAPHTFTGSGETVTVTYEGVSHTATITAASASATATYTSTDVSNAILSAVNGDATLSKLLHATAGSASESVILNSLIDGTHTGTVGSPSITFGHTSATSAVATGTASGSYTGVQAAADTLALSQYSTVQQAASDGTTTVLSGTVLTGGNSSFINNSNVTDSGSSTGVSNVIDLSSNAGSTTGSNPNIGNIVTLTGTGTSVITNYKVGLDTINTVATHGVVVNAVNDTFQAFYTTAGVLNVTAANLGLVATGALASGILEGSSLATAAHVSGLTTANTDGLVVIENATANTTSVYYTTDVSNPHLGAGSNVTLEAVLVGVMPAAAAIHLV